MRRKSGIAAIVGLIAIVLLPMAALASAPIAIDLPDVRAQDNAAGSTPVVLDLDDYAIDADSRDQATSAQQALTWTETGTATSVIAGNELQLEDPTGSTIVNEPNVTFTVSDGSGSDTSSIRVHTTTTLLGGPLVDTQLAGGHGDGSTIPYWWSLEGPPNGSGAVGIPYPFTGGGASRITVTSGFSQTTLYAASQIVADVANPLAPYQPGVTVLGEDATLPLGLQAGNLSIDAEVSIDAGLTGLLITPLQGFTGCVRVTVTKEYAAGDDDSYTIAIGDFLNGTNDNLSGAATGDSTISTVQENYGFDNLTVEQLIGAPSSAAYNSGTDADRLNFIRNVQATNWLVTTGSQVGGALNGSTMPDLEITSTGKPAATYPGATAGNALRLTFNQPANQSIFFTHKGIPVTQYDPGDVITFSINTYFNLGYNGTAADEAINEPTNGIILIMAVNTLPGALSQNLNVVNFAATQAAYAPLRKGPGGASPLYGRGGGQAINTLALIDGKWTRHELSFRVPQLGQQIEGPSGTGNVADSIGIGTQLFLGRNDAQSDIVNQVVWLDNLSITKCPGALAWAYGAINVPMVSAGFSNPFNNGADSGPAAVFTNANFYGDIPMPTALARGQAIFGSFSQGGTGSTQTVTPADPATLFGTAPPAHPQAVNNARAGYTEVSTNSDVAVIGTGAADVALDFPTLTDGNRALVLGPAGLTGNPFTTPATNVGATGHGGAVQVEAAYLDLRLASNISEPGLRVDDVLFNGGEGGNANGENGNLNPDRVIGNISGVFGVRWFTKSNAPSVAYNPRLDVTLINADSTLGLVANRTASVLPSDDNASIADDVWSDDFVSGSVITFSSNQRYYDLILNNQEGGRFAGQTPAATLTSLQTDNPGAQLATLSVSRSNSFTSGAFVKSIVDAPTLNGFDGIFSASGSPVTNVDALPGRYSSAVLSVDEVNLLGVRDSAAFYDEALQ